jgi:glyoxylase-like metal-dependent hydrolase (beta-lactamase superfamily II)
MGGLTVEQLTERLYYLPHTPETDRPTLGYVRGDRRSLLLDGGNSPAHTGGFLRELAARGLPKPTAAAVTHRHWDHTFGLGAVDAPVIAGQATAEYLRRYGAIAWGEAGLAAYMEADGLREFSEPHLRLEYPDPAAITLRPADISFDGTLELDLGGCRAVLRTVPSPHCDDCVLAWLPEERAVFLGDAWCLRLVRGDWVEDRAGLAALWAVLEPLDFQWVLTGHDHPQSKEWLAEDFRRRMGLRT